MDSKNRFNGIDEYAANFIRYKARQMVRRPEFSKSDLEDLEQEMVLDLLKRLPKYDPERAARNTFAARVIDHKVATIIQYRRRAKRACRNIRSLNVLVKDPDGKYVESVHMVDEQARLRRVGIVKRPEGELLDIRLDVKTLLTGLPDNMRRVCEFLRFASITEVSQVTGIPRATIYDRMKRLRVTLCEEDFLGIP